MSIENANSRLESATRLQEELRSCNRQSVLFHYEGDALVFEGEMPSWAKKEIEASLKYFKDSPQQIFGIYISKVWDTVMCCPVDDEYLDDWIDHIEEFAKNDFTALRTDGGGVDDGIRMVSGAKFGQLNGSIFGDDIPKVIVVKQGAGKAFWKEK